MRRQPREIVYGGAVIGEEEIAAVVGVLRQGIQPGANVAAFERRVAALLGKRHGAMVNSGSSALLVAMRLLDAPPSSEVLTSVLTFSTDVSSIVHAGLVPAFVDCELDTYQIDVDAIERMIGPRTRALLVPDLVGGMPDWDRLEQIARRHDLVLVEDSCDTLGGTFRGRPAGERARISLTSFSPHHIITAMGTGGLVAVDSDELWDRALTLRGWGRSSEPFLYGSRQGQTDGRFLETLDGMDYDAMFIFRELGYGFIPSEAGAAFGLAQLDKLPDLARRRTRLFERHLEFVRKHEDVFIAPRVLDGVVTTWLCFPVQLRPELGWSRKSFQMHLLDAGVQNRLIFSGNMTRQPMLRGVAHRADPAGYPNADQIMRHGTMLPCHPTMTDDDCEYLYESIEAFLAKMR
jgi:CDP-6-deoxy-D-xylo-4-hexulose-3-dehydrase